MGHKKDINSKEKQNFLSDRNTTLEITKKFNKDYKKQNKRKLKASTI